MTKVTIRELRAARKRAAEGSPSHRHGSPRTERGESTGPKPSHAATLENIIYSMRAVMDDLENDRTTRDIAQATWELAQIVKEVKDG
jgi:hypothetical protein